MTDDRTSDEGALAALERLLQSHGSDRTRWPAPERRRFASLLATSAEAVRLLREADALDRLLDLTPAPRVDQTALSKRIVAEALREAGRDGFRRSSPGNGRWDLSKGRAAAHAARRSMSAGDNWPAAALLAASLVLGAFGGTIGVFDPAFEPLAAAVSDEDSSGSDAGQLALGNMGAELVEEDLL